MTEKNTYRLPLLHCVLFCLAFFFLGLGVGKYLLVPSSPQSKNLPVTNAASYTPTPTPTTSIIPTPTELPAKKGFENITLYYDQIYFNPDSNNCSATFPIKRQIPVSKNLIKSVLSQLFAGPTEQEMILGYRSVFSSDTKNLMKSVSVADGQVTIDFTQAVFEKLLKVGVGSKCGSSQFLASIQKTLSNFPEIKSVSLDNFSVNGSKETFRKLIQY